MTLEITNPEVEALILQIVPKGGFPTPEDAILNALRAAQIAESSTDKLTPRKAADRALRQQVLPDPEGWTVRDYINHGRP